MSLARIKPEPESPYLGSLIPGQETDPILAVQNDGHLVLQLNNNEKRAYKE